MGFHGSQGSGELFNFGALRRVAFHLDYTTHYSIAQGAKRQLSGFGSLLR
jgi:hypothetical protein